MARRPQDEVTYSEYRRACHRIVVEMDKCAQATPDEAAEHYLPIITEELQLVFAFVGANMTARHVATYHETVARLQAAKDVPPATDAGTLPDTTS